MKLGAMISRFRSERKLSQEALAALLGVSRQSVSKWETDASVPELDKLVKLSQVFGVSLDELVNGEPSRSAAPAEGSPPAQIQKSSRQRITAVVLLSLWGGITLLSLLLGGLPAVLWNSFYMGSPLLVCGLLCLLLRRRVGLWCGWGIFLCVDFFLRFATGITWQDVRFTLRLGLDVRLLIAWAECIFLLVLMVCTLRAFRGLPLTLNRTQTLLFLLGWAVWIVLHTPLIWGRIPAFTSTFLWMIQDDLPAVLLTALLVISMCILPHHKKKAGET